MEFSPSIDLGQKLSKALRLPPGAQRIVIVCDIDSCPVVYVKGVLAHSSNEDAIVRAVSDVVLVQAVADVIVDDDGNVEVTPLIAKE